jgi:hypothetical protein
MLRRRGIFGCRANHGFAVRLRDIVHGYQFMPAGYYHRQWLSAYDACLCIDMTRSTKRW